MESGLQAETKRFWMPLEETGSQHPGIQGKMHRPLDETLNPKPLGLYGDDAQYDKNLSKLIVFTLSDCLSTAKHSMAATWPLLFEKYFDS